MSKHSIEVSKEVLDEYIRLKWEINKMWWHEIDDDQVMSAMIWGFFDSLEYMKNANIKWHEHNHEWECCGWEKKDDDHECCGGWHCH